VDERRPQPEHNFLDQAGFLDHGKRGRAVSAEPAHDGQRSAGLAGVAASAALIGVLTALARLVGFGRWFVFDATVGTGCTASAYAAANQLPNVLFEVAAGGALAGAVVPVLAGLFSTGRRADADRTASALLTWVVVALLPLSLLLAVLAGPLSSLLLGGSTTAGDCGDASLLALSARMLVVFAPQAVLYGIGIVLTGVLQARRRFAGPALAPLLSSLVVVVAYLAFGRLGGGPRGDPTRLPPRGPELVLSVGTTLGVVALSLPLFVPVLRDGTRLRPTLAFPAGVARRLRTLAIAGVGALLAQQAAVLVTIALANRVGGAGVQAVVLYAQAIYLLPYAVLAVPVATAAFPRLSEHAARGDGERFAATAAAGPRVVVGVSLLGTGLLVAAAPAVQALFVALDVAHSPAVRVLGDGLTALAPGLLGWGLVAQLSRTLYALGRGRPTAIGTASGWAVVIVASIVAVLALHAVGVPGDRASVVGLGVGTSLGMLVAGALLLRSVERVAGPGALAGVLGRRGIGVRAVGAAVAAAALGRVVAVWLAGPGAESATRAAPRAATQVAVGTAVHGPLAAASALGAAVAGGLTALVVFVLVLTLLEPGPMPRVAGQEPRVELVMASSGGGVGRHVAALTAGLTALGVPVRVAGPSAADQAFGLTSSGAGFDPVEIADRPRPVADLRALLRLRALAGSVDVVHAHGLRAGALAVLAARTRRARPRVLVTLHNALVAGGRIAAVHGILARIVATGADQVLVVSGDLGAQARALGARRVERALVPAPVRPVRGDPAAVRTWLLGTSAAGDAHLIVTVARLAPQKGLPLLLDAVALLTADPDTPGVRVVVAGDGPLHDELAASIAARSLPVELLGRRDDVPELLAAADVVVVPSVWEGQPLVVQEALRAPSALVATDVGGVREVAGDAALLVPVADPPALAQALRTVLTTPGTAGRLRERARTRALELPTDDDAARQVLDCYRTLAGEPSGRSDSGTAAAADTLEARGAADS
jgi:putative peptidoglycan lipid II flippase